MLSVLQARKRITIKYLALILPIIIVSGSSDAIGFWINEATYRMHVEIYFLFSKKIKMKIKCLFRPL